MLAFSDWFPLATARLDIHDRGLRQTLGIEPGHRGRCGQAGRSTAMWDMTYLGEPQSAAGVPALVPGSWPDQSWAACMDAHLGQ